MPVAGDRRDLAADWRRFSDDNRSSRQRHSRKPAQTRPPAPSYVATADGRQQSPDNDLSKMHTSVARTIVRVVTDGLDREWRRYRDACDRVDLIRYHPAFDSGADLAERLEVAETLAEFIEEAIDASEQLIAAAEQQKDLEDNWLNELRDSHAELQLYAANTQDLVGETERRLRHPT